MPPSVFALHRGVFGDDRCPAAVPATPARNERPRWMRLLHVCTGVAKHRKNAALGASCHVVVASTEIPTELCIQTEKQRR